jgi:aspartyl-tRNA(Asn)/glutamyl-tRNA(Gln) amidotransferase subunit A
MDVIAGGDPCDSTASSAPVPRFAEALEHAGLAGIRIGVPRHLFSEGVDADVMRAFDDAIGIARDQGADVVDVELPYSPQAIPVYYIIATAEASSNLARYDGVRYGVRSHDAAALIDMYERTRGAGFGREVKRRIMLGTYVLSAGYYEAYYRKAQQVRTLIRRDYDRALERTDVIAMPTSPTAAFALGERTEDPVQMYLSDVFTVSANLTGLPAVTVPCGLTRAELPIGLQFTGRAMDDAAVLRVAKMYERATSWSTRRPALTASR